MSVTGFALAGSGRVKGPAARNSQERISVIIPHRNDEGGLYVLLESLARQSVGMDAFEVLVVNNGPAPLDLTQFECLNIISLHQEDGYSYAARNEGIRHARGKILAFTDTDCEADPEWLSAAEAAILQDPGVLVAGHIHVYSTSVKPSLAEKHQMTFAFDQKTNVAYRRGIPTANLIAHRRAFVEVGMFNPDMVSGGDAEWTRRALHHGYRPIYVPDARVSHPARKTVAAIREQRRRHSRAIESFPSVASRFSWLVRWVSPRQGVLERLRRQRELNVFDKSKVMGLQVLLSIYQASLGALRAIQPRRSRRNTQVAGLEVAQAERVIERD